MSDKPEAVSEKSNKSKTMAGGPSVQEPGSGGNSRSNSRKGKDGDKKSPKVSKRRKNQMPSKKRSGGNGFVLSKEDIYYLKTHTRYDEKEIK